ncbi:MAG: ROK family protein [Acidimicrobiales bacterium]|nr:ROK family protein [Acidimicrobiales bacterium]HJL90789.1 ROK family protein [Acidimicrobiales bacterium]HJO41744.1 ROK family protein [Acidimicrobiales bacterium]
MKDILAVDVGATKLAAARVTSDGVIKKRSSTPTESRNGEELFRKLISLSEEVLDGTEVDGCGVGSAGPMRNNGEEISPLNIPQWRNFPLRSKLSEALGIPVALDNDAKAIALGEGWVGAASGHKNYLAMVVSTGIGGGFVIDGKLLDGEMGNAGHIGHINVEPDGPMCACGSNGCLEAVASGGAIEKETGMPATEASEEVKIRCGYFVGKAVSIAVNLLNIPTVLIGGSVALGFGPIFLNQVRSTAASFCGLDFTKNLQVNFASLKDEAPLIGAAAVWLNTKGVN